MEQSLLIILNYVHGAVQQLFNYAFYSDIVYQLTRDLAATTEDWAVVQLLKLIAQKL